MLASAILQRVVVNPTDTEVVGDLSTTGNVRPAVLAGKTGTVDLLVGASYQLDFPLVPGLTCVVNTSRWQAEARTGAATGSAVYTIGTNSPNYDNISAAANAVTAAAFNAATIPGGGIGGATVGTEIDMGLPVFVKVGTPLAGATVAQAHFVLFVAIL